MNLVDFKIIRKVGGVFFYFEFLLVLMEVYVFFHEPSREIEVETDSIIEPLPKLLAHVMWMLCVSRYLTLRRSTYW